MSVNAGIWIDHRRAVIVFTSPSGVTVKHIGSNTSRHNGPEDRSPEDVQDRRFSQNLKLFYRLVIETLRNAGAILILGPGEAKREFRKEFRNKEMFARIVDVRTADKMTEKQLIAEVNEFFKNRAAG